MFDSFALVSQSPVVHLDVVDSTNLEAQRRATGGERGPLWITAGRQTHGRGRSGRSFVSADGAMMTTLLLSNPCTLAHLAELSLVSGIAMFDAARSALGTAFAPAGSTSGLRLKWPNDLILGGAKAGGVLVESANYGPDLVAMIGMGINVATRPVVAGQAVAALADHGAPASSDGVFSALRMVLAQWLDVWRGGVGFSDIRNAWLERAGPLGEAISVNAGSGPVAGFYAGLASDGALLVRETGGLERRFSFGDVTLTGTER
jgi:BirA family biotin operon repressor/biotin-[acetyl-CoA-carboxylase] ligase